MRTRERITDVIERARKDPEAARRLLADLKAGRFLMQGAALIQDTVAAATAVAGYNLTGGKRYQQDTRVRHIAGYALVGSVNPADTQADLFIGNRFIASCRNSRGGANISPQFQTDLQPCDEVVLPNEFINWIVVVAPATNQLVFALDVDYLS